MKLPRFQTPYDRHPSVGRVFEQESLTQVDESSLSLREIVENHTTANVALPRPSRVVVYDPEDLTPDLSVMDPVDVREYIDRKTAEAADLQQSETIKAKAAKKAKADEDEAKRKAERDALKAEIRAEQAGNDV